MEKLTVEVCVDSVEGALAAQEAGADRVELCADLLEGGTTPSAGMIACTRDRITIGLHVIIRPRGGDFCYTPVEFEVMQHDIQVAKQLGANGVVIGILNEDGSIDTERSGKLIALARPMSVTFHRAFDMACDPHAALEDLVRLGIDRLLTSGQESSALEGLDLITALVEQAGNRIGIMPGGGVTERNIRKILAQSGAREVHISGRKSVESRMRYRNTRSFMGGALRPPEFSYSVTDADRVREFIRSAGQ